MLPELKSIHIDNQAQGAYIPILDEEPSFAAKFLTKKDLTKAYKLLKETFREINKQEPYHLPLYYTITNSRYNFTWFVNFFRAIEEIREEKETEVNFLMYPTDTSDSLEIYQPFITRYSTDKILKFFNPRTNVKTQPPINNYRINYIRANYDLQEFQDDQYPGWYLLQETTVFEQYNEKTTVRVKIEFRSGRFFYFIAGASDNWQLIDTPSEIDHVVSALLFRNVLD